LTESLPGTAWRCKVSYVSEPFSMPIVPRYAEIDQQGVVFNGHYLTWFDEACTAFFDHVGMTYPVLVAGGSTSKWSTQSSTTSRRCVGGTRLASA
jgi:hypothetical protein